LDATLKIIIKKGLNNEEVKNEESSTSRSSPDFSPTELNNAVFHGITIVRSTG